MSNILIQSGKWAVDLLYPRRCPFCHDVAPVGKEACPECLEALPYVEEPRCRKCGKPVDETLVYCEDCMELRRSFDAGCSAFVYDDRMRETIRCFKNKGRAEYGGVLGRLLYVYARRELSEWDPQCIIPVPVHRKRLKARGYNHAELLAEEIASLSGIPLLTGALLRTDQTEAMRRLDREGRRRNLRGAFSASGKELPARVLLVDDILTTGSTLDECALTLKEAGAKEVYFVTLCTGGGEAVRF